MARAADRARRSRERQRSRVIVLAANGPGLLLRPRPEGDDGAPRGSRQGHGALSPALFAQCSKLMQTIVRHPKPVIAQVQGIATAAGCQLVASCDLAVASADARFATPGVNIGLFCSTPMVALSRNVSRKHAMEMLLTGDMIAAEPGLAHRASSIASWRPRRSKPKRMALAQQIASKPRAHGEDRQGSVLPPARNAAERRLRLCLEGDDREHARTPKPTKASAPSSKSAIRSGRNDAHLFRRPNQIASCASTKIIAMVGASGNEMRPSYFAMKYLLAKGFSHPSDQSRHGRARRSSARRSMPR